jgi:AcrR family transcriptional regulator
MVQVPTGERVHRAALQLFATRGFEGTGIRRIAQDAGITVASLYHYVGTKEDLLERMMQQSMTALLEPAQRLAAEVDDPGTRLAGLVDLHVRRHAQESQICRVGDTEIRSLSSPGRARVVELRDAYQAIWSRAVADGMAAGLFSVPDVPIATMSLLQMCTGVAHWYRPEGRLSLDELSAAFVEMALAMLGGPPSPRLTGAARPTGAARLTAQTAAAR